MITMVTRYKTDDGEYHESEDEAKMHDAIRHIRGILGNNIACENFVGMLTNEQQNRDLMYWVKQYVEIADAFHTPRGLTEEGV